MSRSSADSASLDVVACQTGRRPRLPSRVAARCSFGFPQVIVSPSELADGARFPTWAWLTCPYLAEHVSRLESCGATAEWTDRAAADPSLASELRLVDRQVRDARAQESGGVDVCAEVGLAGQRDALRVKCLHAHVAYAVTGLLDPIGRDVLGAVGDECVDCRCSAWDNASRDRDAEGGS